MMELRLQKWLAMAGVSSRRKAEELILSGRVTLNGQTVTELGAKANPSRDKLTLDGKPVKIVQEKVYIMLNKPEGVVVTATDPYGRKTVMDLIDIDTRLYPVGRLDADTSGLLLLTNDGEFAQKITHPSNEVKKTYEAVVRGVPTVQALRQIRDGIVIDGKKTAPAQVKMLERIFVKGQKGTTYQNARLLITIHEGRNRQVRNMCDAIGHRIISLTRISVGGLTLGKLEKGKWRKLTQNEVRGMAKVETKTLKNKNGSALPKRGN